MPSPAAVEGINEQGQVVGYSQTSSGSPPDYHAFLWQNGTMTDLGVPLGGLYSYAFGINAHGQIVGMSHTSGGEAHATLWTVK